MNKLYNKEMDIAIGLNDFFSQISFKFSKPQLKVLPHLIMAAINAENITNLDLAKNYIDDSLLTSHSSIEKKIWRFLNNHKFDGIKFFKAVVKKNIKKIGALKHNKLVIILDHMYTNDDFVTLMFALKIGKQSIPIHFINDKDKRSGHYDIKNDDKKFLFSQKVTLKQLIMLLIFYHVSMHLSPFLVTGGFVILLSCVIFIKKVIFSVSELKLILI